MVRPIDTVSLCCLHSAASTGTERRSQWSSVLCSTGRTHSGHPIDMVATEIREVELALASPPHRLLEESPGSHRY